MGLKQGRSHPPTSHANSMDVVFIALVLVHHIPDPEKSAGSRQNLPGGRQPVPGSPPRWAPSAACPPAPARTGARASNRHPQGCRDRPVRRLRAAVPDLPVRRSGRGSPTEGGWGGWSDRARSAATPPRSSRPHLGRPLASDQQRSEPWRTGSARVQTLFRKGTGAFADPALMRSARRWV